MTPLVKYNTFMGIALCALLGALMYEEVFAQSTPEFTPQQVWLSTFNAQGIRHDFLKLHTQDKIRVTQREDGVLIVLIDDQEEFDFAIDAFNATFRVKHWDKRLTLSHWTPEWPWKGWILQYGEGTK